MGGLEGGGRVKRGEERGKRDGGEEGGTLGFGNAEGKRGGGEGEGRTKLNFATKKEIAEEVAASESRSACVVEEVGTSGGAGGALGSGDVTFELLAPYTSTCIA